MIHVKGVGKVYESDDGGQGVRALDDIHLHVAQNEFVSLIGPSGCGKSTLLRIVADLFPPTEGEVSIGGRTPYAARMDRQIGMVFQDAALLDWRTVRSNVALPLELRGVNPKEADDKALEFIELVGLKGFENSHPWQLSGGMKQRVSIARAMVGDPQVLLMDEPFGALDPMTRDRLNLELLEIMQEQQMTILFVTHSISEAIFLSDKVVVMTPRPGRITDLFDVPLERPRKLSDRQTTKFHELLARGSNSLEKGYAFNA